jgi:hypothetical protein
MLHNLQELSDIPNFLPLVHHYKADGYRFITITAVDDADNNNFDLYYHFDKELELKQIKVTIPRSGNIPSMSYIYPAAFLVENEIKELFGVNITDISIDYGGALLLSNADLNAPMSSGNIIIERVDENGKKIEEENITDNEESEKEGENA